MYINQHHTCLMSEHKKENTKLRQQIIDLNVQLNHKPVKPLPVLQLEERLGDLERTVNQERTLNEKIKRELECSQEKFEEVKKLLQESEKQVDLQLTHANKYQKEAQELREKYEGVSTELVKHREDLKTLRQEVADEKSRHEASLIQWSQQEKDLATEVNRLKEELVAKESAIFELEESNSQWAKKNSDLSKELNDLQGRMSVEKLHKEVQMGLSYFHLRTDATQTKLSETSQSSQTEPPKTRTIPSQCVIPALANTGTQTQPIETLDSTIQQPIKASDTSSIMHQPMKTSNTSSIIQCSQYIQTDISEVQPIRESLSSCPFKVGLTTVGTQCDPQQDQSLTSSEVQTNPEDSNNSTPCQKTESTYQTTGSNMIDRSTNGVTPPTRRSFQFSPMKTNLFNSQSQDLMRRPITSSCSPDWSREENSKRALNRQGLPCASNLTGSDFRPQAKYPRLSKVGGNKAAPSGERNMRMTSPFPCMGVKVVSARKESFVGAPILPDFSCDTRSNDLGQSPNLPGVGCESRSVSVVSSCKSILKGSLSCNPAGSTNQTKSVQFLEGHEERQFVVQSPETQSSPESLPSQQQEYKSVVIHQDQATVNQPINSSERERASTEEREEIEEYREHVRRVRESMGTNFGDGSDHIDV